MVVLTDIFLISILIIGYNIIRLRQKDFIREYNEQTVEARGFTLQVDCLPETFKQHKSELCLRFGIWTQIQNAIKIAKRDGQCPNDLDESIVEIAFVRSDVERTMKLLEIQNLLTEIEGHHATII